MNTLNKFVQLQKVDLQKGEVAGILSSEMPDLDNEIIYYDHSKPHFMKWSSSTHKASGGKSFGNVRAMHGGQLVAAGKIIKFEARDDKKDFYIVARIIDPVDLQKLSEGVYTGFSVGGKYGPWKQKDGPYMRREAIPSEATLADRPCNPESVFEFIKNDGSSEMRKFGKVGDLPGHPFRGNQYEEGEGESGKSYAGKTWAQMNESEKEDFRRDNPPSMTREKVLELRNERPASRPSGQPGKKQRGRTYYDLPEGFSLGGEVEFTDPGTQRSWGKGLSHHSACRENGRSCSGLTHLCDAVLG